MGGQQVSKVKRDIISTAEKEKKWQKTAAAAATTTIAAKNSKFIMQCQFYAIFELIGFYLGRYSILN